MNKELFKEKNSLLIRGLLVFAASAVNIVLSYTTGHFKLPLFLDTIGTIVITSIGGPVMGTMTAIITHIFSSYFNRYAMFFCFVHTVIALLAALYAKKYANRGVKYILLFILSLGLFSGGVSAYIQWHLFLAPQNQFIANSIDGLAAATGLPVSVTFLFVNILVDLLDKTISVGVALGILRFIPEEFSKYIYNSKWKQNPLSDEEMDELKRWSKETKRPMYLRLSVLFIVVSVVDILIMSAIAMNSYYTRDLAEKKNTVVNTSKFAASIINPEMIDDYLKYGRGASGYEATEDMLYKIRDNAAGVAYLYVFRVDGDDMTYIFDLDAKEEFKDFGYEGDEFGIAPGTKVKLDKEFLGYVDDLKEGKAIPPTESNDSYGWVMSAFFPVFDANGKCVAYAGADVSMSYMTDYLSEFLWSILLIMAGIFVAIIVSGILIVNTYMVYPISRIGLGVENFINAGDDQVEIDKAVKSLRKINVKTNDEVEKLYKSICNMALNQAEQIRSIRHFSDSTNKMQDGLIVTMADLVERRDTNSGSRIQKTTAYTKIIAEGLLEKGYYAGKVTPKFISDVVRSAPLHDIGKINIPDDILNKEGDLTPEEEEIIRTHTTSGKKIMENAITTVSGENYLKEARNMAAYHHERWDGNGYPEGLHGEVIPLSARILAVAEAFDELTSNKSVDKQYSIEEAVSILQEEAGKRFDPKCVEVFIDSLPEVRVVYRKYNKNL